MRVTAYLSLSGRSRGCWYPSSDLGYLPPARCTELPLESLDVPFAGGELVMEGGEAGEGALVGVHKGLQHQLRWQEGGRERGWVGGRKGGGRE